MSFFDLFRGFFRVPGGRYRGDDQRDPFFDEMTHDDDDDDNDEDYDHGYYHREDKRTFDDALRFGFSFGPNGSRIEEPPIFGQIMREMEEMFSHLDRLEQHRTRHFGVPSISPPPMRGGGGHSGNTLRDSMLKSSEPAQGPDAGLSRVPRNDTRPPSSSPDGSSFPFHGWRPFSKFQDIGVRAPEDELREDKDLDSAVSSGGLNQILTPQLPSQGSSQGSSQGIFHSYHSVTMVVSPDGSVVETRTVKDSEGNNKTTVTRSGGPEGFEGPSDASASLRQDSRQPFSDMKDDGNIFSRFFGGFK